MTRILVILGLLLGLARPAAAFTLHVTAAHHATGTQNQVTITSSTATSLLAYVACGDKVGGAQPTLSTVADSGAESFVAATTAKSTETTRFYSCEVWFFKNNAGSITTITGTWSASQSDTTAWGFEIIGASTTAPQDGSGAVLNNQTTLNPTLPTIITANANDVIIQVLGEQHGISGGGGNGFTSAGADNTGGDMGVACSYKTVTLTGTYTGDTYTAAAGAWTAVTVAFGDGAGAGGGACGRTLLGVGC